MIGARVPLPLTLHVSNFIGNRTDLGVSCTYFSIETEITLRCIRFVCREKMRKLVDDVTQSIGMQLEVANSQKCMEPNRA